MARIGPGLVRRALGVRHLPPAVVYRSLRVSSKIAPGLDALEFPILAGPQSVFDLDPTARVELGGTLFLGYVHHATGPRRMDQGVGAGLSIQAGGRFRTGGWVVLGEGSQLMIGPGARLEIGEGTCFTRRAEIDCRDSVEIGRDCAISWDVIIMDNDAHLLVVEGQARSGGGVRIGDHVWIGARATILKGVSIGDGAVVGAGAVVSRDVPDGCVAVGNPARVVHKDAEWW
ncbi:MAG TPA: acyltransferase [Acidimicrobiales bacterium]|nr:acyltransferase [Acidimicrobiales bacterium]